MEKIIGLQRGKRYADDRAATIEGILNIIEYPDRRRKSQCFMLWLLEHLDWLVGTIYVVYTYIYIHIQRERTHNTALTYRWYGI
jgi:hypothetical protein